MANRIEGDFHVNGNFSAKTMTLPDGNVTNAKVASGADLGAEKMEHLHVLTGAQPNTAAADETRAVHVVHGATGTILAFEAGSIAIAVGDATCTVDLKKNGTTVLTAPITLDSSSANRVAQAGTLSVTSLVDGDLLEVVVDGTIGTGTLPTGVYWSVKLKEKYQ